MKRVYALPLVLLLSACGIEGPRGPQGVQGPSGPDGADGTGLVQSFTCNNGGTVAGQYLALNGVRYEFEDGSVLSTCIVNDRSTSYSTTFLHREDQPGAANGSCLVVFDMDTPSEGYWNFSMLKNGTGSAVYVDPGSSLAGTRVTLNCTRR